MSAPTFADNCSSKKLKLRLNTALTSASVEDCLPNMLTTTAPLDVTWDQLPADFVLDDDPVDNISQPVLAAALTESLELAGKLPATALTTTNYGICATVNGQTVVKAPDWGFVPTIHVPREEVYRSYTPQLQGERPTIVMEFLSDVEGAEYSIKPTYPPGKWFFYEQVLQVPTYAIFDPISGALEAYRLDDDGQYHLQVSDEQNRYWIPEMQLYLGVWQGTRENRGGYWLRWWDPDRNLLLRGGESTAKECQQLQIAEQAREEAEQAREEAEQARANAVPNLLQLGLKPDQVAAALGMSLEAVETIASEESRNMYSSPAATKQVSDDESVV